MPRCRRSRAKARPAPSSASRPTTRTPLATPKIYRRRPKPHASLTPGLGLRMSVAPGLSRRLCRSWFRASGCRSSRTYVIDSAISGFGPSVSGRSSLTSPKACVTSPGAGSGVGCVRPCVRRSLYALDPWPGLLVADSVSGCGLAPGRWCFEHMIFGESEDSLLHESVRSLLATGGGRWRGVRKRSARFPQGATGTKWATNSWR